MKIPNLIRHAGCRLITVSSLAMLAAAPARADYQSTVLGDNPLAFYALNPGTDGTSTAPDLTGNGNTGLAANISVATGPSQYITNAANFNGSSSAIDLSQSGNPALLEFSGPITLEAWAQPDSSSLFADILAKGYDSSTSDEIVIRVNGPYGANYYGSSGSVGVTGGSQTTNWTYIVLSSDGTNCTLYENGLKVAQSADPNGSVNFDDDWMIGNGSSSGNGRLFNGNISEVAIYGHGLTAAQVLNHYFEGLVNTAAGASVPIITTQPQSQPGYVGGSATFSVGTVSALSVTNQWYEGSTALKNQTNATLTLNNLQLTNAGNYSVVIGNANGTTNSVVAGLSVSVPNNLQWSANNNNGTWDTTNSANWINTGTSQQTVFNSGDEVTFDDTTGVPTTVGISGAVFPSLITVNANVNNFSFNGTGTISGSGSLVKEGTSTLNITSAGNFTGSVAIDGGLVYAGNNCFSSVSSITITNSSTLDLGGGSTYNNKPVTVSGAGFNNEGAIYNSYADYPSESMNINLTGDTLFGGSARWDLATGTQITGPHTLTVNWGAGAGYGQWNSISVGATVAGIILTNGTVGSTGNDTAFQNPATVFTLETNCTLSFYSGGWNGSLHVFGGGTVYLWGAPAPFNGSTITLEGGAQWQTYYNSGDEPVNSAMILNGVVHFVQGDHNEIYTNVFSGAGGFVMDGYNHAIELSASNTYSGPTVIGSDGNSPEVTLTGSGSISHSALIFFGGSGSAVTHLDASGRTDGTLTLASGQTLAGVGGIVGNLVVSTGATVSPSGTNIAAAVGITSTSTNGVGAIAATGNITLAGTTVIKLAGSGSNDMVQAAGNMTYGGTLNLVNISGSPLTANTTFTVFSAAGYSGTFSGLTPATPGTGLAWDTTQLSSGIIGVVTGSASPVISSTKVSGGSLIFSGTGGTAGSTYYVLTTTNLTGPWSPIATNAYVGGSGDFTNTIPIPAGVPHQFFRTSSQP